MLHVIDDSADRRNRAGSSGAAWPEDARGGSAASERFARLGSALSGMARDLAAAKSENRRLRRELAAMQRTIEQLLCEGRDRR